jgi:hypothetical protein
LHSSLNSTDDNIAGEFLPQILQFFADFTINPLTDEIQHVTGIIYNKTKWRRSPQLINFYFLFFQSPIEELHSEEEGG